MIIQGEIQLAQPNSYSTKNGAKVEEVRVIVLDRSKFYRCMTPFQISVPVADRAKVFGNKKLSQLADEKVTLCVTELAPQNAFMRCRGSLHMGHLGAEALQKLVDAESAD